MSRKILLDNQFFLTYCCQGMSIKKVPVWKLFCERCDYGWIPRDPESKEPKLPTTCPRCKSPYWQNERKNATIPVAKAKEKVKR